MNAPVRLESDASRAARVSSGKVTAAAAAVAQARLRSSLDWALVGEAERATDIDVGLVNGYGFPRSEGGAVFWARERGAAALAVDLDELARTSGKGFVRATDLRPLWAD